MKPNIVLVPLFFLLSNSVLADPRNLVCLPLLAVAWCYNSVNFIYHKRGNPIL